MAKILEFKRVKHPVKEANEIDAVVGDVEDGISTIVNDCSLTPANRRWLLENMLMDIDDKLDGYKQDLELAESKMVSLVETAEKEIEAAYSEYIACVMGMTHSVRNITKKTSKRPN